MKIADISAIYKGKGSKNDSNSERGIFVVSVYRAIFMKLIYNNNYEILEKHMSTSQIGGRKNMHIGNHIWILNSVVHDVLTTKGASPINLQILDIRQCFDGLWSEECDSDIFQYGVQDNTINLLYDASQNIQLVIGTLVGITKKNVANTVMQGDVLGPPLCSTSIDTIEKECIEEQKHLYKYKENVEIPPLAMMDDLMCIPTSGIESVKINSLLV